MIFKDMNDSNILRQQISEYVDEKFRSEFVKKMKNKKKFVAFMNQVNRYMLAEDYIETTKSIPHRAATLKKAIGNDHEPEDYIEDIAKLIDVIIPKAFNKYYHNLEKVYDIENTGLEYFFGKDELIDVIDMITENTKIKLETEESIADRKKNPLKQEDLFFVEPFNSYNRINLDVPFKEKNEAKNLGAKWDAEMKKWFILRNQVDEKKFEKWILEGNKTYRISRTFNNQMNASISIYDIADLQKFLKLENKEFAKYLCVSEEKLVEIKKGHAEIPDYIQRIIDLSYKAETLGEYIEKELVVNEITDYSGIT